MERLRSHQANLGNFGVRPRSFSIWAALIALPIAAAAAPAPPATEDATCRSMSLEAAEGILLSSTDPYLKRDVLRCLALRKQSNAAFQILNQLDFSSSELVRENASYALAVIAIQSDDHFRRWAKARLQQLRWDRPYICAEHCEKAIAMIEQPQNASSLAPKDIREFYAPVLAHFQMAAKGPARKIDSQGSLNDAKDRLNQLPGDPFR